MLVFQAWLSPSPNSENTTATTSLRASNGSSQLSGSLCGTQLRPSVRSSVATQLASSPMSLDASPSSTLLSHCPLPHPSPWSSHPTFQSSLSLSSCLVSPSVSRLPSLLSTSPRTHLHTFAVPHLLSPTSSSSSASSLRR
jgi:hypothetical protein